MRNGKWEQYELDFIVENYKTMTNSEIAKKLDRTKTAIDLKINRLGLKKTKYNYNHSYFKEIDTEEKAYWLGFIYADGCISHNEENNSCELCIKLQLADDSHLKKFNKSICGNVETKHMIEKAFGKEYPQSHIRLYSKEMCFDLISHGCTPNKTFTITMPNIREDLTRHFIRGFFDGDGCICNSSNSKKTIGCDFTSGAVDFLNDIREILYNNGITSYIGKEKTNTYRLRIRGMKNCDNFLKYMYDDCNIFLERKFKKKHRLYQEYNVAQRLLRQSEKVG